MKTIYCYVYFISIMLMGSEMFAHSLTVHDPQNRWKSSAGSIDSATLTIKPQGAYCEYSYYIYFSANGSGYENYYDTLEIQYQFSLPENSFVTDSWLWVEDTLVQAKLIDRAVAEQIYEGIVKRRRDPSILYKNSQTNYELRAFPLAGNSSRKVKITWLEPTFWSNSSIYLTLPTGMVNISRNPLISLRLLLYTDETWKNPKFGEVPIVNDYFDEFFGSCKAIDINRSDFNKYQVTYDAPLQNGVYVQCIANNPDEGFYQLVILPKVALDFSLKKKTLFMIDYEPDKCNLTRAEVLSNLKNVISGTFSQQDSFNVLLTFDDVAPVSVSWVKATPENIDSIFNLIQEDNIAPYTNLPQLFIRGLNYIKNNGKDASIALIGCSSDALGNYESANFVIDNLRKIVDFPVQINIIDYSNNRKTFYQNNKNYSGNEYFYTYLTQWTGGYLHDAYDEGYNLNNTLMTMVSEIEGDIKAFELYTTLQDGFCYGRYYTGNTYPTNMNQMVAQIGKYYGTPPFEIKATGFHKSISFNKDLNVDVIPEMTSDRTLEKVWIGTYIKTLEMSTKTNDVVREIVDLSMDHRVLSLYTAYLALEPWRMKDTINNETNPNEEDNDDWKTDVDENNFTINSGIKVYPNPFTSKVTINLSSLKQGNSINSIVVFDIMGNNIKTFASNEFNNQNSEIIWDGKDNAGNNLPNGNYLLVINTNNGTIILKLLIYR
ncbi:MAG: T9SS type A sorting domain-containing protein [Ignavibacteriae bacterium]|nr:T9SS type A sorting domain-containing protein [Ignavibacteriota bacterium]